MEPVTSQKCFGMEGSGYGKASCSDAFVAKIIICFNNSAAKILARGGSDTTSGSTKPWQNPL